MTDDSYVTESEDRELAPSTGDEYGVFAVGDESATEAIVAAVASTRNADPLELEPLYDAIDPDALEALVRPERSDPSADARDLTITFSYAGYRISVDSIGLIRLRRRR